MERNSFRVPEERPTTEDNVLYYKKAIIDVIVGQIFSRFYRREKIKNLIDFPGK